MRHCACFDAVRDNRIEVAIRIGDQVNQARFRRIPRESGIDAESLFLFLCGMR